MRYLRKKELPFKSIANPHDWGSIPEEFQGLNILEIRMISIYLCTTTILILPGGQLGNIGGIAYVSNDIVNMAVTLPRPLKDTSMIYVAWDGTKR